MINIIKMGIIPNKPPKYHTTCYNCNTVFEHDEPDIYLYPSITEEERYTMYVTCPLCHFHCIPTLKNPNQE